MTVGYTLYHGDCVAVMNQMPAESVDAIVCDPPYSLSFMSKVWDQHDSPLAFQQWCQEWATAALRVLKPGGHMLSFGGTRTFHRLTVGIEDAGFEVRDSIGYGHSLLAHVHAQGFPKGIDISKAIDKAAGAERTVVGQHPNPAGNKPGGAALMMSVVGMPETADITAPATDESRKWQGWNTSMKPAWEPIVCARKPLSARTVAANVLEHGTGALNIDGCRIAATDKVKFPVGYNHGMGGATYSQDAYTKAMIRQEPDANPDGRWPSNVVFDESMAAELDRQGGNRSRFYFCAKASAKERPIVNGVAHNTVKPLTLCRYLVRLVTPPGGTVLDPFAGSGTTLQAARLEGFTSIGIESEADYLPLITKRMAS